MADESLGRRLDDHLNPFRDRLEHLDKAIQINSSSLSGVEGSIQIMKLEQEHFKEIFETRLKTIERSQELQGLKLDQLINSLSIISTEIEKSPMGRSIISHLEKTNEDIERHRKILDNIVLWQNRVDGVLLILKWIGAGGLVGLGVSILRILKVIP